MAYGASPVAAKQIALCLASDWGIAPATVIPMSSGHSDRTWTYRADSPGRSYFVKLKQELLKPGTAIALLLEERSLPAVAPLLTHSGSDWKPIADHFLRVYPWIAARHTPPSPADWQNLGRALRSIHHAAPDKALQAQLQTVSFVPWGGELIRELAQVCNVSHLHADPYARELAMLWKAQGTMPEEVLQLLQAMGRSALATAPEFCLCHGDLQQDNLLWTADGGIHIVDWDCPVWAPAERDLMFIPPAHRTAFLHGYGPHQPNEPVMSYLCLDWLLQEALDCASRILFADTESAEERQWALDLLRSILPRLETALSSARS